MKGQEETKIRPLRTPKSEGSGQIASFGPTILLDRALRMVIPLVVTVIVAVLGAELTLRIYIASTSRSSATTMISTMDLWIPHPLRGLSLRPDQESTVHKWRVKINSHGFRGEDFPRQKPQKEFRILALGGSVTYGYQLDQGQTWPEQLQQSLLEHGLERIRVINGGVSGYTSFEALSMCIDEAAAFGVDMVVFAELWNDAKYFRRTFPGMGTRFRYADFRPGFDPHQGRSWLYRNVALLFYWDAIMRRVFPPAFLEEKRLDEPSVSFDPPRNTSVYFRNIRFMDQILRLSGIRFVVLQQPWLIKEVNTPEESRVINLRYIKVPRAEAGDYAAWLYQQQAEESKLYGYPYLTVEPFPRDLEHFQDHAHFTPKGSLLYAQRVAHSLIKNRLISPSLALSRHFDE